MKLPLTGGCNCGTVRYEVTEPLVGASYCHCKRCQRRTGASASVQAHPASGTFRIVAGQEKLRVWKPSDGGGEKWFCGECGSAMFGSNPSHPESIGIRMGTFDDDPGIRPTVRQYVAYAAPWNRSPMTAFRGSLRAVTRRAHVRSECRCDARRQQPCKRLRALSMQIRHVCLQARRDGSSELRLCAS